MAKTPVATTAKPALKNPPTIIQPGRMIPSGTAGIPVEPGTEATLPPGVTRFHETPHGPDTTPPPVNTPNEDPTSFANDWYKAFFANYGLPADVQGTVLKILKQYATDPSTAQALAQQYLRTTDWYQQTFPGFAAGQRNGLFTDETGYRGYLNQVNEIFNQYLGRHVSSDELNGYLASGYAPSHIGNLLQGQAWAGANGNDVRYLSGAFGDNGAVSDADLATLGNEHAGIDTARGQSLDAMLTRAQQRLQTIFQGKLAAPSLSLGPNGLAAPSLGGTRQTPDVGA